MGKILDVRSVGFLSNLKDDPRTPESLALAACMTSLAEYMGVDARLETIQAHGREWIKRKLNDDFLAATGMSFGLLWHPENCPSCFDLTQVNSHDVTIRHAFDYAGYDCETIERTDDNEAEMRARIIESINNDKPLLVFGIVGPPECGLICGYRNDDGCELYGWSHFQSYDPQYCHTNGMYRITDWHQNIWKIVLCGAKKTPATDLRGIIERGCHIMTARTLDGYHAGVAAYDAWISYVTDPAYASMDDDTLRGKFWLHHAQVGNHAEARCYVGSFLFDKANGDEQLTKAAQCFSDIHDLCWKVWGVTDGINAPDGFTYLRDAAKRDEIAALLRQIAALDTEALDAMQAWLKTEH